MDASRWRRSGGSIRRHSRTYRLGRAPASDLLASSDARLSVPGADLCWLDLAIAQTAGCLAAFFLTARVVQWAVSGWPFRIWRDPSNVTDFLYETGSIILADLAKDCASSNRISASTS